MVEGQVFGVQTILEAAIGITRSLVASEPSGGGITPRHTMRAP